MRADQVHAQLRRHGAIFRVRDQVDEAIIDVVHGHQRGSSSRRICILLRQLSLDLGLDGVDQGLVTRTVGAGKQQPRLALVSESLVVENG